MAGMGKRMRPHTLTIPKPLINVAGKPIVQRLAEDIVKVAGGEVNEIAFIIGDFGQEAENNLLQIASKLNAKGRIYYQHEALGTAHAINCAAASLQGNVIVAFADTLFEADFNLDLQQEGIIWTHRVDNPSAFGVVKKNQDGVITDFVEKPKEFVSDEAIIGIYYFRDGQNLQRELQYLIDNNIVKGTEYQLTDALENMKTNGMKFYSGRVKQWLDCGNKDATVDTNSKVLDMIQSKIANSAQIENCSIIHPCFIGENVQIKNSVIGPHVSIGGHSHIQSSVISQSILQDHCTVIEAIVHNSMIGSYAQLKGKALDLSLSDYSEFS